MSDEKEMAVEIVKVAGKKVEKEEISKETKKKEEVAG
jgi:hypothetical protein